MNNFSIGIILILLVCRTILSQENNKSTNNIEKYWISSSDNLITSVWANGDFYGKIYNDSLPDTLNIPKTDTRFSPAGDWITDNLLEIRIPTCSTTHYFYYYNLEKEIVSMSYNFRLTVDSLNLRIACLEKNKIKFYDIFSDSLLLEYSIDGLAPIEFLAFCRPNAFFDREGNFHLKYDCINTDMMEIKNVKDQITIILNK